MKNNSLMMILILAISTSAACQSIKVPAAVQSAFTIKFPLATNVKWEKESAKEYEAEFKIDQNTVTANFASDGKWIETESMFSISDLPLAITSAINTKYPGALIKGAEKVEKPGNLLYELTIKVSGKKKGVELTPDGRFVN